ncbi:hypothetical protein [Winogradskyella thalassocola]|uniref:Uncharacterized protein n=1 Tax=Winogradskyella thalassocola TaxID=262004 RepID=A0A1G8D7K7_9FLAO|nr:hypothetical protein [Winogradskyella thalassocola]SDH53339.1 hypothetical protein SAMN04489796_103134 [Winogradskyella thalassocola]
MNFLLKTNWLEILLIFVIIYVVSYVGVYYKDWIKPQNTKGKTTTDKRNDIKSRYQPKALAKEQTYNNFSKKDTLKSLIRERMIKVIKETSEKSPMKDTPLEGLIIQNAIGTASEKYKVHFLKERHKLGMTEQEIKSVVDEVTKEMLERFLE